MVGHEEGVELAGFQFLDQLLDMREIEVGVGPGARVAPGAGVDRDRPHECAELELPLRHLPHSVRLLLGMSYAAATVTPSGSLRRILQFHRRREDETIRWSSVLGRLGPGRRR